MQPSSKKRPASEPSRSRLGNIFSQLHKREQSGRLRVQFRSVPDRLQIPLKNIVPVSHHAGIFLCFSRDGLLLLSYCVSFSDSCPTYTLQLWESPLSSKDDVSRRKLHKVADIPLFVGCPLQDRELENSVLEPVEEKHLQIHVVETRCGCFVITGNWPDTGDQPQQVCVTIISPLCDHMTALHFSYICYGPASRPTVIPLDSTDVCQSHAQRSFVLIVNTVDAFRTLKVSSAHSLYSTSIVPLVATDQTTSRASQFFKTQNWLCDLSRTNVVNGGTDKSTTLTIDKIISLEIEPVLACWLSRLPPPRCILRDYNAICVPSPDTSGDFHAIAVLYATSDMHEQESGEVFAILAMTVAFDTLRLSINKLNWSKSVLRQATRSLVPSFQTINANVSNLSDLCAGGALLYARQCYLPCSKTDQAAYTNNAPVFNHQSRPFLLNPCFPVALVL